MRKRFGSRVCALGPGFRVARVLLAFMLVFGLVDRALAQMETATLSGTVTDSTGAVVKGAEVRAVRIDTGTNYISTTNTSGLYLIVGLQPGHFRIFVTKQGFKQIELTDVTLNVQDTVNRNFNLEVGAASETVTVRADDLHINTTDATVSTVVDRQFAENLPLNGRSFQTLIELTPGVVLTPSSGTDGGQFSVNGQRASANYWMVDGVSANIGSAAAFAQGNGVSGALPSFSVQGGTNSLVSVDAMQEFRIQTSTYAPEFGRTPGGQISIVTRSGTNQFHGTAFDYLRNDLFDANGWFANEKGLSKPKDRQNDFGGTLSGQILKDKTFFFFSYEGLRLRLPQTGITIVPDASFTPGGTTNSRQNASQAMQPFLNAYPLPNPNSPEIFVRCNPNTDPTCPASGQKPTGTAQFNASFSNSSTLNATSLRLDHKVNERLSLFGRYNYSPSQGLSRPPSAFALSVLLDSRITTQTATVGATWSASPATTNDFRFNYSRNDTNSSASLDNLGGAVPPTNSQLNFPSSFTPQNSFLDLSIFSTGALLEGKTAAFLQQQYNFVDNVFLQKGSHSLKFGVDYRRLTPSFDPRVYQQFLGFSNVPSAESGQLLFGAINSSRNVALSLQNLGVFGQDTWRISSRLNLTYGLRWDVDFSPSSDPAFAAVTNFSDLSALALAPNGTSVFNTRYRNIAPRVGAAFQLSGKPGWETVLRGGFGVFFDLATVELGNLLNANTYPFGASKSVPGGSYPLNSSQAAAPPISVAQLNAGGRLNAFDPNLELPYTLQWNVALEQSVGTKQAISASYIGAAGRRLLQTEEITSLDLASPNPNFTNTTFVLVGNYGTSDYEALQVQFQRRLSRGLQALASYSWSHSLDTASASSASPFAQGNIFSRQLGAGTNRGPSDFDIRNSFSAGVTYDVPAPRINAFTNAILRGWSLENLVLARSAAPVNVVDSFVFFNVDESVPVRPDLVAGQPFYLHGSQFPGGKALNPAAFVDPPNDPNTGVAFRQGNLGRNALRGFGAWQWDFAVHRAFPIHESLKLQFRAEMFNVLNHPNFGQPSGDISGGQFGVSTQMLGQSFNPSGGLGTGAFSPLYQIGGPRSIQFALKLTF